MAHNLSVYRHSRSPYWWACCYVKGEGGRKRRWSTQVLAEGDESRDRAMERAQAVIELPLKPLPPLPPKKLKRRIRGPNRPTLIYFVKAANGPVKIGSTKNLYGRIAALRADSPVPLEVIGHCLGILADEKALHRRFWHLHSHGEWFHAAKELLSYIESVRIQEDRSPRP
jgi:hypothetical protein